MISILANKAVRKRARVIISIHGLMSKQKPIYNKWLDRALFSLIYPYADHIVTVSQTCAKDAINYLKLPEKKIEVIYNPIIDERLYSKAKAPISDQLIPGDARKTVLSIGRLESVKDHLTLLKAFRIVKMHHEAKLLILGEGSLKAGLQKRISEMGLEDDILLPGFISNPYPIINNADVLAISSLHEALPNVIVEALACRCPVVSTACGGPEEILGYGKYGHLVSIGDFEAMAEAIIKVFEGDTRLAEQSWLDQFSVERNIDRYIRLIETNPKKK
jgi:glycosyltransferase involved in cell wall biosynthesis